MAWKREDVGGGWPESCSDTERAVTKERGWLTLFALSAHLAGGRARARKLQAVLSGSPR